MLKPIKTLIMLFSGLVVSACAFFEYSEMTTLFDGSDLQNLNQIGNATWTLTNGYVEGTDAAG